jgi:hypothetical protein
VLVATAVWGAAAALLLVGEALRLALLAPSVPGPARAWLLAAATALAATPTLSALTRLGLRAAREPAAAERSRPGR